MADQPPPLPEIPPPPPTPPPGGSPLNVWLEKSGVPGKIMAGASLVGLLSMFLPAVSVSTGFGSGSGGMPIQDWRGILCLLSYIAVLILGFLIYTGGKTPAQNRGLLFGVIGAAGGAVLFGLLLVVATIGSSLGISVSPGFGTILNFLAALGVGTGAFLKAKEDRLF